MPIDSENWSNLGTDLFEDYRVIKFNGKFRETYPNSNLGEVGQRSFKLRFLGLDGKKMLAYEPRAILKHVIKIFPKLKTC